MPAYRVAIGLFPLTYTWDFGDGSVGSGLNYLNASHFYSTPGNYTVRLTTTFSGNVSKTATFPVRIASETSVSHVGISVNYSILSANEERGRLWVSSLNGDLCNYTYQWQRRTLGGASFWQTIYGNSSSINFGVYCGQAYLYRVLVNGKASNEKNYRSRHLS